MNMKHTQKIQLKGFRNQLDKWSGGEEKNQKRSPNFYLGNGEMVVALMEIRNNMKGDISLVENNEFRFRSVEFEVLTRTQLSSRWVEIWVRCLGEQSRLDSEVQIWLPIRSRKGSVKISNFQCVHVWKREADIQCLCPLEGYYCLSMHCGAPPDILRQILKG